MSGSHSYDHEPKYSCPHFDAALDTMQTAHTAMHTSIEAAREINHTLREQCIEFVGKIDKLEKDVERLEEENENLKEKVQQLKSEARGAGVLLNDPAFAFDNAELDARAR